MKLEKVFGISSNVNKLSYIDRGNLDTRVRRLLNRDMHIALNGASKSGKSWLMQQCIANANVVQCRLNESIQEVYAEALANLGGKSESGLLPNSRGTLEESRSSGTALLIKSIEIGEISKEKDTIRDLNTLRFIADLTIESGQKLVIENFHYLSTSNRKRCNKYRSAINASFCYS